jgi:hypothetical protein
MSSATSTDTARLRPWHFFLIAALVAATGAVLLSRHTLPEQLVLLSVTVFAAGSAALACYRVIAPLVGPARGLRSAAPDERGPGSGDRGTRALEREKQLVLRSIKELEFDRAMGKVADSDFADLIGRLKARAMRIMRQLEHGSIEHRQHLEAELEAALAQGPLSRPDDSPASDAAPRARAAFVCTGCGTANDRDARFCKNCGTRL